MPNALAIVLLIFFVINLIAFVLVGIDKRKSMLDSSRVPEVYLFFMAALFGSVGVFLGMFVFHHKTRKVYFPVGIGLLLVQQMLLVYFFTKPLLQ